MDKLIPFAIYKNGETVVAGDGVADGDYANCTIRHSRLPEFGIGKVIRVRMALDEGVAIWLDVKY